MDEQKLLKKKQKGAGNKTALVSACTDLAAYYSSVGKFSKAIKEYEIVCDVYKEDQKLILYAQTSRGIGEAYMGLLDFKNALKYFKIYLDVSSQQKNVLEQQRALAQLGHMYLTWYLETAAENNKELLNEAFGYFIRSMKKCESLPDNVEKQDMLSRLFSNLGLVKESLGDYDTSLNLYEKSIRICLKHDLYEQLYRGYLSKASLSEKQEKYQETVKSYNLAIEVAKKLSTRKTELICAALLAKSETLLKIADFIGAKQMLRKAYKFKSPNRADRLMIERNLRVVAGMCKIEDEVITCNDQKHLKNLYEKMGDGACDLKIFPKAIEYYKKMLDLAEQNGASDKELGECYYSLGETYKDNGQYKDAEFYFEKEYNVCSGSLKDSLNTLCKIADVKEMANDNLESIKSVYQRGLENCKKKTNLKEEKRLLMRYMEFLRRSLQHSEAFKVEQQFNKLNETTQEEDSSSSDYESEDSAKIHIGDDIVLSDITDISDQSDDEMPEQSSAMPSKRRKQSTIKFKKNLNGEWPLHVACIKGNLKMAQHWLGIDHPVNVRDNAGWLPLHEAAVHGHLDIVKVLLDHKANINDRGGAECNGITPLHDAASNGHLEIIELLLNRGASAVAKTDDGHTPLFELMRWYERTSPNLNGERQQLYSTLVKQLEQALEKAGQKDSKSSDTENLCVSPAKSHELPLSRLRRNICTEDVDSDLDADGLESEALESYDSISQSNSQVDRAASNEYQFVMQTLRHKNYTSQSLVKTPTVKRAALIDAEQYMSDDEWLEEDVRPMKNKKRRKENAEKLWERSRSFEAESSSSSNRSPMLINSNAQLEESLRIEEIAESNEYFFSETSDLRRRSNESNDSRASTTSKKRTQVTLLDAGFSKRRSSNSPLQLSLKRHSSFEDRNSSVQTKITTFGQATRSLVEADSTTLPQTLPTEFSQTVIDPTLFVDVEIEGRLFRVPILLSQIQTKTIKWLAEEAAHRYASKEFMKPVLELETKNGAVLADEDVLSLLFPMATNQAEKVVARVTQWSLSSLIERYKDTCHHMNVDTDQELCQVIETLSVTLDVSNRGTLGDNLSPLLKAINHQKVLTEINLSGNFLNVNAITMLCASLGTLVNLQVLNFRCTGLQPSYFSLIANAIITYVSVLSKLSNLDLSDNVDLGTACLGDLSRVTSYLNLRKLNLSNIGLSNLTTFQEDLCLKTVEELDVSSNSLGDNDFRKLMCWIDGRVLKDLDVSNNLGNRVLNQTLVALEADSVLVLEKLNLQRCGVNDTDLFELLRLAPSISHLNLSYNVALTSISLRRLLEHGTLCSLNLLCCENIWKYFNLSESRWTLSFDTKKEIKFKISNGSKDHYDCLVHMFKDKYPNCKVNTSFNFLCIQFTGKS